MSKIALRFSTLLILVASFSVVTSVMLVGENLQRILTLWGESLQMTVYLSENTTPEITDSLKESLMTDQQIDRLRYVTREEALGEFKEQMASYAPDLLGDKDLLKMIPPSFQFSLNPNIPTEDQLKVMQSIATRLQIQPGVEEVSYGQDWVKNYIQVASAFRWSGIVAISVILAAALFVISNCLRSSIYQRKEEIEILELVGATSFYIRRPFLFEGVLLCLLGATIGLGVSLGFFYIIKVSLRNHLTLLQISQHIQFLKIQTIFSIIAGSVLIGWLSARQCLKSLNDGWAASQKTKV